MISQKFPTKPTNVSNFWPTLCRYGAWADQVASISGWQNTLRWSGKHPHVAESRVRFGGGVSLRGRRFIWACGSRNGDVGACLEIETYWESGMRYGLRSKRRQLELLHAYLRARNSLWPLDRDTHCQNFWNLLMLAFTPSILQRWVENRYPRQTAQVWNSLTERKYNRTVACFPSSPAFWEPHSTANRKVSPQSGETPCKILIIQTKIMLSKWSLSKKAAHNRDGHGAARADSDVLGLASRFLLVSNFRPVHRRLEKEKSEENYNWYKLYWHFKIKNTKTEALVLHLPRPDFRGVLQIFDTTTSWKINYNS